MSLEHPVTATADANAVTAMLGLISGFFAARAVYVAAKLEIADLLAKQPKSAEVLAAATKSHAPSLKRLLRVLAAMGVLSEHTDGSYTLTQLGETLRTDSPQSLRFWAMAPQCEEGYRAWGEIMHCIKSGENGFVHAWGIDGWEYRSTHPDYGTLYDQAMSNLVVSYNSDVVQSFSFASVRKLIDVGGGDGSLLIELLRANPAMRGVLLDLPHVAKAAHERISNTGLSDRCEIAPGDAMESVPSGADTIVISRVVHNWADTEAIRLLANCKKALPLDGRLLLIERVLPELIAPSPLMQSLFLADLNMMIMHNGHERTASEFERLLKAAGFQIAHIITTSGPMAIIEAIHA